MTRIRLIASLALAGMGLGACDDNNGPNTDSPLIGKDLTQVDRFGLPAIATVFIPTARKDEYNTAVPANDQAAFRSEVVDHLNAFGNPTPDALADALLPDIQPVNTSQTTAFLNGRRPQDDVITAELGLIFGSNADLNDDHVDANDKAFLSSFPYLAEPFTQ
jgi:hypothetical protein